MTLDVVEYHDGLVDQDPHRQGQTTQRHRVDRVAGEVQADQRRENRNGDGDDDHQRRSQVPQKDKHDQTSKQRSQHSGNPKRRDALADLHRLIHHDFELQCGHLGAHHRVVPLLVLQSRQDLAKLGMDPVDNFDRVGSRLPVDRHVDQCPTVDPHDVGLDLLSVFHLADVTEENRLALRANGDRSIVEIGHSIGDRVGVDVELAILDLGTSSRDQDVLTPQRRMNLADGQPMSPQFVGLDVAEDPAKCPAVDGRSDHAGNRLQVVPQVLVGDVVEFRVRHVGVRHRDQAQRNTRRRIKWHHHRRNRARWQVEHVAHGVHAHLAQRFCLADPRMEEILDDADSLQRLRLLVLDPGTLTRPTLQTTHDVLLHHLRWHPGVEADDLSR